MNLAKWAILGSLAFSVFQDVTAQEKLYRVNSKEVGWGSIDLTITETQREPRVSHVTIPRYRNRTSVESRFAMCAFTDIAIQRKFAAWVVSDIGDDKVLVGFLASEEEDVRTALDQRFAQPDLLKASVSVINRMCGIKPAPK
jgi:hypothetical protein